MGYISAEVVEGECQTNQISSTRELMWDISIQLIAMQKEKLQTEEVSQLRWDVTVEFIASKIESAEKGEIAEGWRDGAAQIHVIEIQGNDSVWMTAAAGDRSPVAEVERCGSPTGHD